MSEELGQPVARLSPVQSLRSGIYPDPIYKPFVTTFYSGLKIFIPLCCLTLSFYPEFFADQITFYYEALGNNDIWPVTITWRSQELKIHQNFIVPWRILTYVSLSVTVCFLISLEFREIKIGSASFHDLKVRLICPGCVQCCLRGFEQEFSHEAQR